MVRTMAGIPDIDERSRAWVAAGLVDAAQADRIVAFERELLRATPGAAAAPAPPAARDRMQALFGVFGALLVGLGVLLTVITNWDSIGDLVKLGLLVGTMLVAYGGGLLADGRGAPRWVGTIAYVVGMLVFAGGIFVVADMYNVQAHEPFGPLLIALFGTGIALLADRMAVGWIAAVGWLGWAMFEVVQSLEPLVDEEMMAPLFASVVLGAITAVSLGWALSSAVRRDSIAVPLRNLAMGGLALALVQASFAWHLDDDISSALRRPEPWIALVAAIASIGLLLRHAQLDHRRSFAAALAAIAVVIMVVACWPNDVLVAVVASVVLGLGGVGLVLLGLVESRRELFGWGIAWLVALVVTRYADFMASVDLGGPGFIGAGLLLIVVAVLIGRSRTLWRRREEVLQ
jgi:uncharacterized membrane protein